MKKAWQNVHTAAWYAAEEHGCLARDSHTVGQGDRATIAQLREKELIGAEVAREYGELQSYSFDTNYMDTARPLADEEVATFIVRAQAMEALLWRLVSLDKLPSGLADSAFREATQRYERRRKARIGDDVPLDWV